MFRADLALQAFEECLKDVREELYNPRSFHCYGEEDFNGCMKKTCRAQAGRNFEYRVMRCALLRPLFSNYHVISFVESSLLAR